MRDDRTHFECHSLFYLQRSPGFDNFTRSSETSPPVVQYVFGSICLLQEVGRKSVALRKRQVPLRTESYLDLFFHTIFREVRVKLVQEVYRGVER